MVQKSLKQSLSQQKATDSAINDLFASAKIPKNDAKDNDSISENSEGIFNSNF